MGEGSSSDTRIDSLESTDAQRSRRIFAVLNGDRLLMWLGWREMIACHVLRKRTEACRPGHGRRYYWPSLHLLALPR
jgi:hypothetical protein